MNPSHGSPSDLPLPRDPLSEETLLSELGWVRQLALRLVRDPEVADDVAQEAYLVAREHPPHRAGSRLWFARLTRSLVRVRTRGERRRAAREERASRPERDDTDLVEAIALRRDVAAAVLTLAEPYRSTLLRYHFEERSVGEIAELGHVSEAAVRQRLVRARAALRERLAATFGGGPRGWIRALLPLLTERDLPAPCPPVRGPWLRWTAVAGIAALVVFLRRPGEAPGAEPTAPPVRYAYEPRDPDLVPDVQAARQRGGLARWLVAPVERDTTPRIERPRRAGLLDFAGADPRDEAERLSADLSSPVTEVRALEELPRELLSRVAEHSGHAEELVRRAELFEARTFHRRSRGEVPVRVVRMPLDGADEDQRMTVVVHEERALTLGVWGSEEYDEDPDGRWSHFAGALQNTQSDGPTLRFTGPSDADLTALRGEFDERLDEDGQLIRALLDQRLLMGMNSMQSRVQRALPDGETGPADWFPPIAQGFRSMAKTSSQLAPVLGPDQAEEHGRMALAAAEAFERLGEAAKGDDAAAIDLAVDGTSTACRACHNATTEDGATFFDAFDPYAEGLDLPRGVAFVGLDLPVALGGDAAGSRRLATAFRAALLLANEHP